MDLNRFHVLTVVSNPIRYESRYKLYHRFRRHMEECGIKLWTVEVAFGHREFEVTRSDCEHDLQLRTHGELWHKENALNLLVERLPTDWKSLAWVDADIEFANWRGTKAWYLETLHALQHHRIVQLFQNAVDLGPNHEALQIHQGFAYSYVTGKPKGKCYTHWHPGYAWAIRRKAFDAMGGFIDWGILGSGDAHMASAWIGAVQDSVNPAISPEYMKRLLAYQNRCEREVRRDIGYLPGTILHHFHGKKKDRRYTDRWKILTETQFDPDVDIHKDWQGLYQLTDTGTPRSIELRDRIRQYFRARKEDSSDLE
jgi:hypothetical protein